ncbi:MAG: phosphate acyltransferase [Spirochaetia bacterium]|nr:phosphate acyltransferase [Spirochaetia bacterium]
MLWLEKFKNHAKENPLSVILSEGDDLRVIGAAKDIHQSGFAKKVTIIGNTENIKNLADKNKINLEEVEIIDPDKSDMIENLTKRLFEIRSSDYASLEEARREATNPLVFGTLLHESGYADIHISGAVETSAAVIRAFFQIIRKNRKEGMPASFFFVDGLDPKWGENGALLFADCAVNISPGPKQLAHIAHQTGNIAKNIFGFNTRLSLLSYSTKGSGSGELVDAVLEAGRELEKLNPDFLFEVEMQSDAAIVPEVSERKAHGNSVEGRSNVLIFPDLQSGNIAYKLVERFAGAHAYGPIMVGLNKTSTDLSRGCSRDDITGTFLVASYYHLKK